MKKALVDDIAPIDIKEDDIILDDVNGKIWRIERDGLVVWEKDRDGKLELLNEQ